MWLWDVRIDFSDGYEIVTVEAETPARAKDIALAREMDAIAALVVGGRDPRPQAFLAW